MALSEQKACSLSLLGDSIIPEAWASVRDANRLFLLEVACSPDSLLTDEATSCGQEAARCSIWNDCDLRTGEGLRKVFEVLHTRRPRFVWIATDCGAFSPMQNLNQRTEHQKLELLEKQRDARKQHVGGLLVAYEALRLGSVVCWEWSRRCRAWKWDMMDEFRNQSQTRTAIIGGCRVGLKDPKTSKPLGKEWRVECSHDRLAQLLHRPCICRDPKGCHAACEGSLTRLSAFYTRDMARRVIHHMLHLETGETLQVDMRVAQDTEDSMSIRVPQHVFSRCWCAKVHRWSSELVCSACSSGSVDMAWSGELDVQCSEDDEMVPAVSVAPDERARILKYLALIHSSTGHGSYSSLLSALRRRRVDPKVMQVAQEFRCSACEERKRPDPRHQATLEVHRERWRSIQVDGAFWKHPGTNKRHQFVVILDEASRFMVSVPVRGEGERGIKALDYIHIVDSHWKPYFGVPDVVRADPEGPWRSRELAEYCSQQGTLLETIPAEAHWNLAHVERAIQWIKELLTKLAMQHEDLGFHVLVNQAVHTWNHREQVRGYSPFQHALGRQPDPEGRLFEKRIHDMPSELLMDPDADWDSSHVLRASAERAFVDWQLQEKLSRAKNSRHHLWKEVYPGDLVFYWRSQAAASDQHSWNGKFVGPARVLAVETKREGQMLCPSSVVWLVRGSRLVKVAIEQIRPASARELALHELERPSTLHAVDLC